MLFSLKNAGATYQKLVKRMFEYLIGKSMEVYVADMLVNSKTARDHIEYLTQMFNNLQKYRIKLNLLKCAFGFMLGKFLGFMVNQRGIEANHEEISALLEMSSPRKPKEIIGLAGRVAALSRFMSRATDCCASFFNMLKWFKKFKWMDKCEHAFLALKEHLGCPPLLSKPVEGEKFYLYLTVSEEAVSATLVGEEEKVKWPIYYMSKRLLDGETRYPKLDKIALVLMVTSRKLRPYSHALSIEVLTNYPLC